MSHRAGDGAHDGVARDAVSRDGAAGGGVRTPGGGLDGLLGTAPVFSGAVRGYDRGQVDEYVAWAETEVLILCRENDHLLSRLAAGSAELDDARRRLAEVARERVPVPGPGDPRTVLLRAEREAAAVIRAAEEEARRVLDEARTEAAARLAGVAEMREAITSLRDQTRSEAGAVLEAARREAESIRLEAARERERLDREAAEARTRADAEAVERRRAVEAELVPLRDERDEAREWLRRLTGQIDDALAVVAGVLPDDVPVLAERREAAGAADTPREQPAATDASQVTVLHGSGRAEVAAAS
jgi:cell division septum initiation protein DivIVA